MGQPKIQKSPSKAYNGALEALYIPKFNFIEWKIEH